VPQRWVGKQVRKRLQPPIRQYCFSISYHR
jgi:hypothetical protein